MTSWSPCLLCMLRISRARLSGYLLRWSAGTAARVPDVESGSMLRVLGACPSWMCGGRGRFGGFAGTGNGPSVVADRPLPEARAPVT